MTTPAAIRAVFYSGGTVVFKVISTGWNCLEFAEQTLASIQSQTCRDFQVSIAYESATAMGSGEISNLRGTIEDSGLEDVILCVREPGHYLHDVRSRYEATMATNPADDDIIVTLDLDGDELAHEDVLEHLLVYYADGALLTYGNYAPVPPDDGCPPVLHYPEDVVARRAYREFREVRFNHLRTMKGRVFKSIPVEQFQFSAGPKRGEWYTKGNDVEFTFCGLERVGRRFRVIDEVLMHYNSINPNSNWRIAPEETWECVNDFLNRPPLEELS